MSHRLGMHWMRTHQDGSEFNHIAKMQYKSIKIFDWMFKDHDFCNNLLAAAPHDALILLRDQPLSEQKQDMYTDPVGTGNRHADDWANKFHSGQVWIPPDRAYPLGINEPESNQYQRQIDQYTEAYCRRLSQHGLHGGAYSFGVGHPSTVDLKPENKPDWHWYEASHQAIVQGQHLVILHEYGLPADFGWGYWCNRLSHCPWQDIKIVIGECGIDGGLSDRPQTGWKGYGVGPVAYTTWLDTYMVALDSRVHSCMPFTYDYAHPWSSFDVKELAGIWETFPWRTGATQPPTKPPIVTPPAGELCHPCPSSFITQHFYQNPIDYQRFGLPGHNGTDFGIAAGTPVLALADGDVAWVDVDADYGNYVRLYHPQYKAHSFYAHLKEKPNIAGKVKAGQQIGLVGSTGNATGPHLHLEIRLGDDEYSGLTPMPKGRVDPETWCSERGLKL